MNNNFDRNPYMSFLPEYLRDNKDFQVFLKLLISEFDITMENIEKFTDLVDPDKVPIKFIEALGSFSDYRFIDNADDDFNREILTRMQTIYEQRGTDKSIVMAATHGSNHGWVGGDIFIPGYDISKDTATLVVATSNLFTHSRSKHSGIDVFADSEVYRPGVLIINLPYINDDVIKAVTDVMPAGVRFKFFLDTSFVGNDNDGSLGEYGELSFYKYFRVVPLCDKEISSDQSSINLNICSDISVNSDDLNILKFSTRTSGKRYRSGRMLIQNTEDIESYIGSSLLSIETLKKNFASGDMEYIESSTGEKLDVTNKHGSEHLHRNIEDESYDVEFFREVRLTAKRSSLSGARSGNGKSSGIISHVIDSIVNMKEIMPTDTLYDTYNVKDLHPFDFRDPFYFPDIEISRSV